MFFFSIGEDAPTEEDIDYFGLYSACKNTRGEFALFKDGKYAARGRIGMSPLYWNREELIFSFTQTSPDLEEFPEGHLYNAEQDRLVCWDPVYYDKPMTVKVDEAVSRIRAILKDSIEFRLDQCDAFLLSAGAGSRLIDTFLPDDSIHSYTISFSPGTCFDVENIHRENRTILYFDETTKYPKNLDLSEAPMYILARYLKNTTNNRKFLCGLGCTELFSSSADYRPYVKHVTEQFSKFGLEVYSPFFDAHLIEYVLDVTSPHDRPMILRKLIGNEEEYGQEICDTVGAKPPAKKRWFYW